MAASLRQLALRRLVGARNSSSLGAGAQAGEHAAAAEKLWRNLSIFAAIPAVIISSIIIMKEEHEHPIVPPEFKPYDHLRIRKKNFPWGDGKKSLFHNPHTNPLPTGYEEH